jgi:hypothetical protein
MAQSTGPILAVGGVTMLNQTILNGKPIDWRVPIATGFLAGGFALFERANSTLAVGLAWVSLVTVLLARVDPKVPSPTESLLKYWNSGGKK